MKKMILASASPRRRELLEKAGFIFEVKPSHIQETIVQAKPKEVVQSLALQKALDIAAGETENLVLGADTIVVCDGEILGKPKDEEHACNMLERLQGRTHMVYTGVALVYSLEGQRHQITFCEGAEVEMYPMTSEEICKYVTGKEPMDKAGAYAIQGEAMRFIKEIQGDYYAVVGLPIGALYQKLKRQGLLSVIETKF